MDIKYFDILFYFLLEKIYQNRYFFDKNKKKHNPRLDQTFENYQVIW